MTPQGDRERSTAAEPTGARPTETAPDTDTTTEAGAGADPTAPRTVTLAAWQWSDRSAITDST